MKRHVGGFAVLAGMLGACARFSPDAGMGDVQAMAAADLGRDVVKVRTDGDAAEARRRTAHLLEAPLPPMRRSRSHC